MCPLVAVCCAQVDTCRQIGLCISIHLSIQIQQSSRRVRWYCMIHARIVGASDERGNPQSAIDPLSVPTFPFFPAHQKVTLLWIISPLRCTVSFPPNHNGWFRNSHDDLGEVNSAFSSKTGSRSLLQRSDKIEHEKKIGVGSKRTWSLTSTDVR